MRNPLVLRASLAAALLVTVGCTSQRPMLGPDPSPLPRPGAAPPQQPLAPWPAAGANAWLAQHPAVAATVVWETDRGPIPWARWDQAARHELEEAYAAQRAALQGTGPALGFPVPDPPENIASGRARALTILPPRDAFRIYIAHVAQSLALEALRFVPWSIAADTPESLRALLDGRRMFTYRDELGGYLVDQLGSGWIIPGPPSVELGFLIREKILAPTRRETIERMITWARRLHHFSGRMEHDNAERIWQYRGVPPVSRVLAGTGPNGYHTTAGCWGTTGLFIAVLRAANIPVRLVNVRGQGRPGAAACSHAQPYFVSEHVYLSHGDDPYNRMILTSDEAEVPARRLLLSEATWSAWFGPGVDPRERCANVGRTTMEIALETLPGYLVDAYCLDARTATDPRAGKVARAFSIDAPGTAFPFERLQAAHLGERLAEKANRTGACWRMRPPPPPAVLAPQETGETP